MSPTKEQLWSMLREARGLPWGPARIAAFEQVLWRADASGDRELAFAVRMDATSSYVQGGEPGRSFVTFSWCLSEFDNDPAPYHGEWEHTLLWQFKHMVGALLKFPEVPLARTYDVLDDMERRYRAAGGDNMQPVYKDRHHVAAHIGDTAGADEWYERWVTAPRSALSDCIGCDPSSRVFYLASRGRDEDAIEVGLAAMASRLTCSEQPQGILGNLVVPYLRTGRITDAVNAHLRSYRVFQRNIADMYDVAEAIELCARTGNEHRGLEILQRHVGWLPRSPSPATTMYFAAATALLMRRLDEIGHGDVPIRRDGADVPAGTLRAEMSAQALEIARRFDARNGTTARSAGITSVLEAEPYAVALPLTGARPDGGRSRAELLAEVARLRARVTEVQRRHESLHIRLLIARDRDEPADDLGAEFDELTREVEATNAAVLPLLTGVPERLLQLGATEDFEDAALWQVAVLIRGGRPEEALDYLSRRRPKLSAGRVPDADRLVAEAELEIELKARRAMNDR